MDFEPLLPLLLEEPEPPALPVLPEPPDPEDPEDPDEVDSDPDVPLELEELVFFSEEPEDEPPSLEDLPPSDFASARLSVR